MVLFQRAGLCKNLPYGELRRISLEAGTVALKIVIGGGICPEDLENVLLMLCRVKSLMTTSAQVVETSVNVTTNSPSQDYTHPDDHNLPTYDMTSGFKPLTVLQFWKRSVRKICEILITIFSGRQNTLKLPLFVSNRKTYTRNFS